MNTDKNENESDNDIIKVASDSDSFVEEEDES